MDPILTDQRLLEACKYYRVKELYVFGSFALNQQTPNSDVDFLVTFERNTYNGAFEQFMGFKELLEELLQRPVDLLTMKSFRNPLFQEEINKTKQLIYAA